MKKLSLFLALPFLIAACKSISVVRKSSVDEPGTYYYLPKTILEVDLEGLVYTKHSGRFSTYSEEMIGQNPNRDTVEYKASKIKITATSIPDESSLFLIKNQGKASVQKTSSGIIQSVNTSPVVSKKQTAFSKLTSENKKQERQVLAFHKRLPVVVHTHTKHAKKDTSVKDTTIAFEIKEVKEIKKSASDIEYDSALLYQSKLQHLESLISDYTDCENCENAGTTKVSLKLIEKLKKDYLSLFIGTKEKNKSSHQFSIDDKKLSLLKTEKEIKISDEPVLKKNNLLITIKVISATTISTTTTTTESGFVYKIPTVVLLTVIDTKTKANLISKIFTIALSGSESTNSLPKNCKKIAFDSETGAVILSE